MKNNSSTGKTATIEIDGVPHKAAEGENLMEVLRGSGVKIPAVCYHPALKKASAACRLCLVEIETPKSDGKIRRSCIAKVQDGMRIITDSDEIRAQRSRALNHLLSHAPQSEVLFRIAEEYHLHTHPQPDGCIRCHLCRRVCDEIVGAKALKVEHREGHPFIVAVQGKCIGCGTCANICPTKAIQVTDHDNVRTITIRDEVIGQHPLERCEGCGQMVATPRFLEHVHQRTAPHPDVKEHHRYCPACAKIFSDRIRRLGEKTAPPRASRRFDQD